LSLPEDLIDDYRRKSKETGLSISTLVNLEAKGYTIVKTGPGMLDEPAPCKTCKHGAEECNDADELSPGNCKRYERA